MLLIDRPFNVNDEKTQHAVHRRQLRYWLGTHTHTHTHIPG